MKWACRYQRAFVKMAFLQLWSVFHCYIVCERHGQIRASFLSNLQRQTEVDHFAGLLSINFLFSRWPFQDLLFTIMWDLYFQNLWFLFMRCWFRIRSCKEDLLYSRTFEYSKDRFLIHPWKLIFSGRSQKGIQQ